jgi:cell wall-associated NlpC family hydrolase
MTHVAIALGKGLFAHAQGTVHVNSLSPSNPLYDKRLAASLRSIGRP